MDLSVVLTYIGIIIAVFALSPEHLKIRISLAHIILRIIFVSSILLIFLFSFNSILYSEFIFWIKEILEGYIGSIPQDIYWLILRVVQFTILGILLNGGKLRNGNQKKFKKLLNQIFAGKQWNLLFTILNNNLDRIFSISFKKSYLQKIKEKHCNMHNISAIHPITGKLIETQPKKGFIKKYIQKLLCKKWRGIFGYSFLLDDILTDNFIEKLGNYNEALGLKFIEKFISYEGSYYYKTKEFCKSFLTIIFTNLNNVVSYQLAELDYSKEQLDNKYTKLLINNADKIGLEKIIDVSIHQLLFDENNKKSLNLYFSPSGQEYNTDNKKIVNHVYRLMKIYKFIDKDKLDLGSMPIFLIKDLLTITDRSLYTEDPIYEYTTATHYLIITLFEVIEDISDKSNGEYLSLYFTMIGYCLGNKYGHSLGLGEITENFKKEIIRHCMYFFCNNNNKEIKKQELKKELLKNQLRKSYFNRENSNIDRTGHYDWGINKDVFEIIDNC